MGSFSWNKAELCRNPGKTGMKQQSTDTDFNRAIGIDIGCYNYNIDKLKYHLKLVSVRYKGTYKDLNNRSYGDPDQGFYQRKR